MNSPVKADNLMLQVMRAIEDLIENDPAKAPVVRAEIQQIIASPDYRDYLNLADLFHSCLNHPAKPLLVCCRTYSPVAVALFLNIGTAAGALERLLAGQIDDADFTRITSAAGKCARADVWYCEAKHQSAFMTELTYVKHDIELVLCDWKLTDAEIASASELVADQGIRVIGLSKARIS